MKESLKKPISIAKMLIFILVLSLSVMVLASCTDNNGTAQEAIDDVYVPTDSDDTYAETDENIAIGEDEINWEYFNNLAREFIYIAQAGDYEIAADMFTPEMYEGFGAAGLQEAWEAVAAIAGPFIEIAGMANGEVQGFMGVGVRLRHTDYAFAWNIFFTEQGEIAGLQSGGVLSLSVLDEEEPQPLVETQRDGFRDIPIVLGQDSAFALNGLVSLPDGASPGTLAAVVIVHGSGPMNMDGTLFGVRPYADIADYLAENGIAVIRFDKRTYAHGALVMQEYGSSLTVWQEVIEDVLLAASKLREFEEIDSNHIYLLGHSMGGMLAPRILEAGGDFAGIIMMAGSPRTIPELFIEQNLSSVAAGYEMGLVNEESKQIILKDIEEMQAVIDEIPNMSVEQARATTVPMINLSAYYILDMITHPFESYAQKTDVPMLIMQGSRDFQVLADTDFAMLSNIFADRDNVTFKLYENLDHRFMITIATNFIEHAAIIIEHPDVVYETVLEDIVYWIKSQLN